LPRDYAKSRPSKGARRSSASRRSGSSNASLPGWIWLVVGLSIGLVVAAIVYVSKPKPILPSSPSATAAGASAGGKAPASATPPGQIPLPPKQPSRFSFYEMLPSYEVVIPREDAKASSKAGKPTTAEIAAPGQYLIQVGSYKTRDEADRARANLALLGVESRIEQVTIDQSETWFRVRIGPESSLAKAQETLDRLDENGIKGVLVKVKSG
jgi:cell division protein FtsN